MKKIRDDGLPWTIVNDEIYFDVRSIVKYLIEKYSLADFMDLLLSVNGDTLEIGNGERDEQHIELRRASYAIRCMNLEIRIQESEEEE